MKCTSKLIKMLTVFSLCASMMVGCSSISYSAKYSINSSINNKNRGEMFYPTFASDICVVNSDITEDTSVDLSEKASAGLFDLTKKETIYARNVNEQVMPASLTKVMTAYVALKYGTLDQVLVADSTVSISESGAQKINLKSGDRMTLDQALHILLIYSANDVANLIASNICDSIEEFVDLMNKEAVAIGATNSHFVNANGLTADDHYVTAYDMYLMFNAAMQYDTFNEIISLKEYNTTFLDSSGNTKEVSIANTNGYLSGAQKTPNGVTVIGGKTGTTQAAGHCLILLARDTNEKPYIAVIMRDTDSGKLYNDMTDMLNEIVN